MLKEMKSQCSLSLEHNPQVGFGWQWEGEVKEELENTGAYLQIVFCLGCRWAGSMYVCFCFVLARLAWPRVCLPSSSHRVGLGALCEWLPVSGQLLLRRGRGERHFPSPPSQCTQGAYRHVRGGWPWQPTIPVQWSQEVQVGHALDVMSCLFTVLNDGTGQGNESILQTL